ncbi:LppX_LprAFG lipoprotein [Streptomyces sp. ME19-01-6]|uniref:LppX_LprAFG lipoprotein n=1 Tax=Streptomyces sp. ME19-01-6 TaxID=3028686 RepID=UPI0029AE4660|nr:LppX_LprAFG lipoprotein [Streptomyces sp. ME19-01-6]MDX3225536.1 LppX_LprAFG lipoprotein [Streptomyces sp. ME19-01-6]
MAQLPGAGRATAVGVACLLACTALTACGSDAEPGRKADGSASSSGGDDGAAVRTAFDRTAEADTARMTLRTQTSAAGQSATADGKGVIDLSAGDSTMTISAAGQKIEQRVVDQVVYQKVPERQRAQVPGKKPWVKIDLKKAAAQQNGQGGSRISDPAESAGFAKGITDKDTRKVGTEKIDGVNTTHYRVTVDVDKLSTGAKLKRQVGPTLPMDVWLDDKGRIRRQQVDMTIKATTGQTDSADTPRKAKVHTRIEFSDFGTEVEAQAPPADETADLTDKLSQTRH